MVRGEPQEYLLIYDSLFELEDAKAKAAELEKFIPAAKEMAKKKFEDYRVVSLLRFDQNDVAVPLEYHFENKWLAQRRDEGGNYWISLPDDGPDGIFSSIADAEAAIAADKVYKPSHTDAAIFTIVSALRTKLAGVEAERDQWKEAAQAKTALQWSDVPPEELASSMIETNIHKAIDLVEALMKALHGRPEWEAHTAAE
jgi:hypothetical protein